MQVTTTRVRETVSTVPPFVRIAVVVLSLTFGIFSQNSLLFLFGMAVAVVLVWLFFDRMEPPVLLLSVVFGWFFFQGQLFGAIIKGESIITLNYTSETKPTVIVLGFIAVFFFSIGLYITTRGIPRLSFQQFRSFLLRIKLEQLILIYLVINISLFLSSSFIWLFSGLTQPIFLLGQFKWSLFFLLFSAVFMQDRLKFWLFIIIVVDIGLSFFSFFASFKEVIYFSFISYWIFYFRTSYPAKFITILCVVLTFYLGAYWTAIKDDYRNFLNRGTGAQTIRVSREEAYSKLKDLALGIKSEDFNEGMDELLIRLSWIRAFDAVYNHVPSKVEHQDGALWLEGIKRPFLPRLLFPSKKILADSKELNYYSGLGVDEEKTSISLSMVAGSYIDFGMYGMHIPLFLFGMFCGWVFRKAIKWGHHPVVGYAMSMPMIYLMQINEQSINRIVSSVILYLIVLWFVSRFLLKPLIRNIMISKTPAGFNRK